MNYIVLAAKEMRPTATPKPTAKPTAAPKPTAKPTAAPKPTAVPDPTVKPSGKKIRYADLDLDGSFRP
jgi:hypothetical protein